MRESTMKDKILSALINKACGTSHEQIADHLVYPEFTVYTLLWQMNAAGHIELIKTTTANSSTACSVRRVMPQGKHFHKTTSYRKQAIKRWWLDAPKNFWVIGALLGLLSTNAALIVELVSRGKTEVKKQVKEAPNLQVSSQPTPDSIVTPVGSTATPQTQSDCHI